MTDEERLAEGGGAADELAAGAKVGRYIIGRRLGAGGMGVVYVARDTELARDVALKIVRPRGRLDVMQARLRREAQAMARLSHAHVVPVFDIGTLGGHLFLAMELVDGDTLRAWVARPRPWRDVVRMFVKAGRGLEAAHAAGLLHRDFKPDNVMVGAGDEPRITDFGRARDLDGEPIAEPPITARRAATAPLTATGTFAGTPAYIAPELLAGGEAGAEADQFSFCVALFELLYGARPFPTASAAPADWLVERRAGEIVVPPAPRVPAWLHAAVIRGLAFEPAQRWPSMRALIGALERGLRRRGRVVRGGMAAAALGGLIVLVATSRGKGSTARDCLEVARDAKAAATIIVCKEAYGRTADPRAGAALADALLRAHDLRGAATLAGELLATPVRADALYTLGKVALAEHRRDDAARSFRLAGEQHRAQHAWGDAAADQLALTEVSNDVVDQLVSLEQAVADARRGAASKVEAYAHLAAARLLAQIGAGPSALGELARADPLVTRPSDRLRLDIERGNVHQELGAHAIAIAAFERALASPEAATIPTRTLLARFNLVYSLAEAGRVEDASRALGAAAALDPEDRRRADRLSLEARIAARSGDPGRAAVLVERALAATDPDDVDDLVEREVQRAALGLDEGQPAVAEAWARKAIAHLTQLRSIRPPSELRSWLVTDRRLPHELVFASLAARGDVAGALVAVEQHRGLDVLAGLARDAASRDARFPADEVARFLPALEANALAIPPTDAAVLDAAHAATWLVLVVARGELWRITADAGRLSIARIGALAALAPQLARLRAAPADRAAASALGVALIPEALARPTDRVLHVVLDPSLAGLPVAALRVGDRPVAAARPIVHVLRVASCEVLTPRRSVRIDAATTRAALFGATPGDRVVLAAAVEHDALVFGDGRVHALELAAAGGAAQVVIAAPSVAATGTTPIALALVAGGAQRVIAAVRPVPDAIVARLAERLDDHDLARALARLQAGPDADDWLGFAAFGRPICNTPP